MRCIICFAAVEVASLEKKENTHQRKQMFAEPRYVDPGQRPAGASGSPRFGEQTSSDINLQMYAERIQSSLQDLLDVMAKYKDESGDYFTDQNTNGHRTLEEVRTSVLVIHLVVRVS
jgi:hypothetical protein